MNKALLSRRYELKTKLGEGGMAAVYLAYDQRMKINRAIKLLLPHVSIYPQITERFEQEASTMANLHHNNIVTVYDITNHDHLVYMVMEFLGGGSLMDRIKRHGVLHPIQAINATIDMLKGLGHAHQNRVIHRDIKPHNLLISEEGVVQISDFGIARAEDSGSDMTQTGAVLGTICYMSPEQRRDSKSCTERSDLFSAGATFFTLLTDEQPMDVSFKSIQDELFKDLDDDICEFLRKACHAKPEERHQTAQEMIDELEAIKANREPLPSDVIPIYFPSELGDFESLNDDPGHQSIIKAISKSTETDEISPAELEKLKTQSPTIYPDENTSGTIYFDDLEEGDEIEDEMSKPVESPSKADEPKTKPNKTPLFIGIGLAAALLLFVLMPKKDVPQNSPNNASDVRTQAVTQPQPSNPVKKSPESNDKPNTEKETDKPAENLVKLESDPTGADVLFEGKLIGSTPHPIKVDPKNGKTISLSMEGYQTVELTLSVDNPNPTIRLKKSKTKPIKKKKSAQRTTTKKESAPPKKTIKKKPQKKKRKNLGSGPVNPF